MPLISPATMFCPTSMNLDAIPFKDIEPSLIPSISLDIASRTDLKAFTDILLKFSIALLTAGISRNDLTIFLTNTIAILIPEANLLKDFTSKLSLSNQFLNATIASPTFAVTSRTFKSNAFNTALISLNAIFKPPPAIVRMISIIANKPLNDLLSLSTVSLFILRVVENLCRAAIMLYKARDFSSVDFGGNISFHAFFNVEKTCMIALPMFLNESISKKRPLSLSVSLISSLIGIPVFSDCCCKVLKALTSSSV